MIKLQEQRKVVMNEFKIVLYIYKFIVTTNLESTFTTNTGTLNAGYYWIIGT